MSVSDSQYKRMVETPIPKLITSLAAPTVISMLVTNIYNLADTFFVSHIGTSASGAVGITAALSLLLQATGLTFGHGAGSVISRTLGGGNNERAGKLASTAFFSSLCIGFLFSIFGLLFLSPLLRLLGSTETVLPYAKAYGIYILIAAPFTISSFVLNNIMRYEGKARLAMIGLTFGAVLNTILDPIFIFSFKMGVHGAGLSTALSQILSFLILLYMFVSKKTDCRISVKTIDFYEMPLILKNGLPTLARQSMNCVSSLLINRGAAIFGDAALSAVSIVNQICNFIVAAMIGIGQGYQPVAGYNFGAGRLDRLKKGFYFTFFLGEITLTALSFFFFLAADNIVSTFRSDPEVIRIGTTMLRLQCISLVAQPFCTSANMMFQSIGKTKPATFLAVTRNGLFLIPALLVMPRLFGLFGFLSSQPVADIASLLAAIPLIATFFYKNKEKIKKP